MLRNAEPDNNGYFNSLVDSYFQQSVRAPFTNHVSFYSEYAWTSTPKQVIAIAKEETLTLTFLADANVYIDNMIFHWDYGYRVFLLM
uniref:Uncharacterized protein n=1 Tax=Panagrolaimus sp. PS1159 TaxID=55785 RepID=A0AC35FCT8_9BILA